jgi:hypothetical protein
MGKPVPLAGRCTAKFLALVGILTVWRELSEVKHLSSWRKRKKACAQHKLANGLWLRANSFKLFAIGYSLFAGSRCARDIP